MPAYNIYKLGYLNDGIHTGMMNPKFICEIFVQWHNGNLTSDISREAITEPYYNSLYHSIPVKHRFNPKYTQQHLYGKDTSKMWFEMEWDKE